jgi:hypothetical protein
MALLRLAEWIVLAKQEQGCDSCNDKIPPRADQADCGTDSASESLGSVPVAGTTVGHQYVDQDARPSIACNRKGAER